VKALVTGGAGFIGSHLVERLVDEGHHVDVIDDLSAGSARQPAAARSARTGRLTIHQVDLRDAGVGDLIARRSPEVVFHLAAHDDGAGSVDRAVHDAEVNVVGTLNVLDSARRAGCRKVVFSATGTSVYEVAEPADLPLREKHRLRPLSPHGVAQKAAIDYLVAYRETFAVEFTALVLANVYGPRQRLGVVASMVDRLAAGEPCALHGKGAQTRDFVYVDDVVDAFVRAADRGGGLVVNIGTGVETSITDLLAALTRVTGRKVPTSRRPARAGDLGRFALDPARARIHLGWRPWTTLDDGLAQVLAARS
jgi:UDP-glucose 4-epimerase